MVKLLWTNDTLKSVPYFDRFCIFEYNIPDNSLYTLKAVPCYLACRFAAEAVITDFSFVHNREANVIPKSIDWKA